MLIKRTNPSKIKRNNRKQTMKLCERCGKMFGPVNRLSIQFCSVFCARSTGRKKITKTIPKAKRAQSLLHYYLEKGKIVKPDKCEECGKHCKVEAAHRNYDKFDDVRWLCTSCHRKWDWREPKNVTYSVDIE